MNHSFNNMFELTQLRSSFNLILQITRILQVDLTIIFICFTRSRNNHIVSVFTLLFCSLGFSSSLSLSLSSSLLYSTFFFFFKTGFLNFLISFSFYHTILTLCFASLDTFPSLFEIKYSCILIASLFIAFLVLFKNSFGSDHSPFSAIHGNHPSNVYDNGSPPIMRDSRIAISTTFLVVLFSHNLISMPSLTIDLRKDKHSFKSVEVLDALSSLSSLSILLTI